MVRNKTDKKKNTKNILIVSIMLSVFTLLVFSACKPANQTSDSVPAVKDESLRRGETRETLPPSMFVDPFIAEMYQVAKDIPHVLDSLNCYCLCDRDPFHHVSLLSCYVEKHAAG